MGTYNEDSNFNLGQMADIARTKNFCSNHFVRSDQWSLDSANRVISLEDGIGQFQCKVKFNPKTLLD